MVCHFIVYNLEDDGMFNGSMSRHSKGTEKGLYLVTWGVSDAL